MTLQTRARTLAGEPVRSAQHSRLLNTESRVGLQDPHLHHPAREPLSVPRCFRAPSRHGAHLRPPESDLGKFPEQRETDRKRGRRKKSLTLPSRVFINNPAVRTTRSRLKRFSKGWEGGREGVPRLLQGLFLFLLPRPPLCDGLSNRVL